jgi:hypothetical protein
VPLLLIAQKPESVKTLEIFFSSRVSISNSIDT